jgi:hypothetical protein
MENNMALLLVSDMLDIKQEISRHAEEEQFKALAAHIEDIIQKDFNRLLHILYRVDVSEEKLKKALSENKGNLPAGEIIAHLLIERQIQKINFRAKYKPR